MKKPLTDEGGWDPDWGSVMKRDQIWSKHWMQNQETQWWTSYGARGWREVIWQRHFWLERLTSWRCHFTGKKVGMKTGEIWNVHKTDIWVELASGQVQTSYTQPQSHQFSFKKYLKPLEWLTFSREQIEIKNHKWSIMRINVMIIKVKVDSSVIWSMKFTEFSNWKFKICNRKGTSNIKVSFIDDLYATISFVLLFSSNVKRKLLGYMLIVHKFIRAVVEKF